MLKAKDIELLEKLIGKVEGFHAEITALVKKSVNDGVNKFKLKFINEAVSECNSFLPANYRPLKDFEQFDLDDVPTTSDVTFILSQYLQALENFRAANIDTDWQGSWFYKADHSIHTGAPRKLKK